MQVILQFALDKMDVIITFKELMQALPIMKLLINVSMMPNQFASQDNL
jgi:hypothetical protein